MRKESNQLAYKLHTKLPENLTKRTHVHQTDFGDVGTLGWKLKRKGCYAVGDTNADNLYAMYLGEHDGKYVVGVLNLGSNRDFSSSELFDNRDEMRTHWVVE